MSYTDELLPCPMCGSKAAIDSTGASECYGYAWQTVSVECMRDKDPHCGMQLSVQADFFYVTDHAEGILADAWNKLHRVSKE